MTHPGLGAGGPEAAGRYEILRVVNRGGMGEIALARVRGSKGFEKLVVLKRLRADAERDDHREMFDVEAELMSRIEHPNIVQVFDQPRINGVQYLAMGYVRGRNLDQVIRRTRQSNARITPTFALTVIGEVLRGLAFVHRLKDNDGRALGVVHQDVTPSNILVSFFGEVKITDFGIAYVTSRDGGRRAGVLKGKPRYVAPEVLAGRRVNNRADIYGCGVVMYELLTGQPLFARSSVEETLSAVARNELPEFRAVFRNLAPQAGEAFYRVFAKSLAKDPQDRYRTAEEMHADVAAELARLAGPLSTARLGYLLRQWFAGDPDVPESDPHLDAALAEDTARPAPAPAFQAPNLDQTITELDRLLGGETSSADLFQLPPEIHRELEGLEDAEPFAALTPIPQLALSGPNGEELLLRGMTSAASMRVDRPPLPPGGEAPRGGSDPFGGRSPVPDQFSVRSPDPFGSRSPDPFGGRSPDPFASRSNEPFSSRSNEPFSSRSNEPFSSRSNEPMSRSPVPPSLERNTSPGTTPRPPEARSGEFKLPPFPGARTTPPQGIKADTLRPQPAEPRPRTTPPQGIDPRAQPATSNPPVNATSSPGYRPPAPSPSAPGATGSNSDRPMPGAITTPPVPAPAGSNPPVWATPEPEDSALVRSVANRARRAALGTGEYTFAPNRSDTTDPSRSPPMAPGASTSAPGVASPLASSPSIPIPDAPLSAPPTAADEVVIQESFDVVDRRPGTPAQFWLGLVVGVLIGAAGLAAAFWSRLFPG